MRTPIPLGALLLGTSLVAQPMVVPSAAATLRPTSSGFAAFEVFYGSTTVPSDSHTQLIYATSDVSSAPTLWQSLQVRRPSTNTRGEPFTTDNPAASASVTIVMALSPLAYDAMTTVFANNLGASPTTVFSAQINLPARAAQAVWPAPWEAPFPFRAPFSYQPAAGQSLVVDITQLGNSSRASWFLEAQKPDDGRRLNNGSPPSSCKFSNSQYNNTLAFTAPVVGGSWTVTYGNLLPNVSGFAWIGTEGIGGTFHGMPLPIDMQPFGAPGCFIHASADYLVGLTAVGSKAAWPSIPIPNDRVLGGTVFYDHSLWLDRAANALGGVTGWSSKWIVGGQLAPAAMLMTLGLIAGHPYGALTNHVGVTLRLNP